MSAPVDRIRGAFRALVLAILREERVPYLGVWEYQVTETTATTFSGRALAELPVLPDLVAVPLRASLPGVTTSPTPGSTVLVAFVNGDPGRPVVVAYDGTAPVAPTGLPGLAVGPAAVPVALAGPLQAWVTNVEAALQQVAGLLNAPGPVTGAPGSVVPPTPLGSDVASTTLGAT